jgi:replication factor A1
MSNTEDVIKKILATKPTLNREAVERLIAEEKNKAAGLLTDEAAANLVASNLGLDGAGEKIEARLKIGSLTSGLNDVSITGRVVHLFPPRTFSRSDGRQGKVLRLLLGDSTGIIPVVFWDEKADHVIASKIVKGKIIRVLHGYSRERQVGGELELNIGWRGQVYMEPLDAIDKEFPDITSFFKTPADINSLGTVNIEGVIVETSPSSAFTRKDGSEGKVSRITMEEGGAQITIVLWDEKVDELASIEKGTRIRVIGGASRSRQNGGYEIHLSRLSEVEVLATGVLPNKPASGYVKISDLREGMRTVSVGGRVIQINESREFTRRDGTKGKVASLVLQDETGIVRLSLWDDDINILQDISKDTIIAVENGYTRSGTSGIDLNVGRNGRLRVNPEEIIIEKINPEDRITPIKDLVEGQKNVIVQGQLLDEPLTREVNTLRGPTNVVSFRIDDGTGEARISLWGDQGKTVEGLTIGSKLLLENCNVREPFDGLLQVSSNTFTKITIIKK